MQNLEKALKKTKAGMTILIIVVILLLLYTIIVAGDISSAKTKAENRHSTEMVELEDAIAKIADDTAADEEKIAKYNESIAELEAQIANFSAN